MEIYILIAKDPNPQGPYSRELIRSCLKSGQLQATDQASYAGQSHWIPLSEMMQSWNGLPPARSRKRKPVPAILVVAVLLLVAAGGAAFWMLWNRSAAGKDNSSKTEAKAVVQVEDDGYPKTLAELNKWYVEPPEGQNAATFFFKGASAIQVTNTDTSSQSLPIFGRGVLPTHGPLLASTKKSITAFVQKNEPAWQLLQEGSPYEHSRYPLDLTQGADALLPHLAKVRMAVQLGALRTVQGAENKQPQQAVDAFLLSLVVAQSVKDEPVAFSQLIRAACCAIQKDSLQYVMNSVAVASNDLERLAAALAKVEAQESEGVPFTRALAGARVLALSHFDLPLDQLEKRIDHNFGGSTNSATGGTLTNLLAQRRFVEETFGRALASRKKPFPERLEIGEYMKSRTVEARDQRFRLCQIVFEGEDRIVAREANGLANVRLMQTAVALEQFRRAHRGTYPDLLTELAPTFLPAVPADPFTGQPLFYQKFYGYELHCTGASANTILFRVETPPKLAL